MEYTKQEIHDIMHLNIVCKKEEGDRIIALINELETNKANLTIPVVRQQRELLIAYNRYLETDRQYLGNNNANIDDFLRNL